MSQTTRSLVLIDDEQAVLFALKLLLQTRGFAVHDFHHPRSALTYLATTTPDLIMCDLRMPELTGIAVLKETRGFLPFTPFILMSAHASDEERFSAQLLGCSGFLAKPWTLEEFHSLVDPLCLSIPTKGTGTEG